MSLSQQSLVIKEKIDDNFLKVDLAKTEKKATENGRVSVVLDLDGTCVIGGKLDPKFRPKELQFILQLDGYDYIILPGAIAFLQWLYAHKEPAIDLYWFSSASEKRNRLLVKELLILALGEEQYNQLEKEGKVKIFSRDDAEVHQTVIKKNLHTVSLDIQSTILIDDHVNCLLPDQLAHGLIVPSASCEDIGTVFHERRPWDTRVSLQHIHHLFYAASLLQDVLTSSSSLTSIIEKLFDLQYEKEEELYFSIKNTGFLLLSYLKEIPDLDQLEKISEDNNNMPLLIKVDDQLSLYSKPDGKKSELTKLDSMLLKDVSDFFPSVEEMKGIKIDSSHRFLSPVERSFSKIVDDINKHKRHRKLNYVFKAELYEDKSRYLKGLKILQPFDSKLNFVGKHAQEYFNPKEESKPNGLTQNINHTLLGGWSRPVKSTTVNEASSLTPKTVKSSS